MSTSANKLPDTAHAETAQSAVWKSDFGREYTDRNRLDTTSLNDLYRKNYGITRTELNAAFWREIARDASFLEIGCNAGNQLALLFEMGHTNLSGVELQPYALEIARKRLPQASLAEGSVLAIPHGDSSFDVVFTSGVLIHISPNDLPRAMDEIYRCAKRYIWGVEYYAPETMEVSYRSQSGLLWKMDYARGYLERFCDLELVREQRLPYLENANVDSAFLLRKKS